MIVANRKSLDETPGMVKPYKKVLLLGVMETVVKSSLIAKRTIQKS